MKLFLILFLAINIYANKILEIKDDFVSNNSANIIYYTEDINNTKKSIDILKSKDLKLAKKTHLGSTIGPFWTRLEIKNISTKIQNLALYNSRAGMDKIDVYIYKDSKLIKTHMLGDLRDQNNRELLSRYSMFILTLDIGEKVTIVSKIKNYQLHNIDWIIKKGSNFFEEEFVKLLFFGMFFGFTIIFILYTISSYFAYKDFTFLLISITVFSFLIYIMSVHGILYQLNLGINLNLLTSFSWTLGTIPIALIILFPYFFFHMRENYPKLSYYLIFKFVLILLIIIAEVYVQYFNEKYFVISLFKFLFIILNSISLLSIAIYMNIKKEHGANYYLFGQGSLLFSIIFYILNMIGYIPPSEIVKYTLPLGMFFDFIFLTFAQYIKSRNKIIQLENKKKVLLEQSRFNSIGQAIGDITHQWKTPLTYLGTSVTTLETVFNHKKEDLENTLNTQLPNIKNNINLMKNTIDEFTQYYSGNIQIKDFEVQESFDNILKLLHTKIVTKNVNIELKMGNISTLYGYEHIFSNILLVFISNSIDQFKIDKTNRQITINLFKNKNNTKIIYQDNAGGITIEPIERVFDYFVSTKETSDNSGMGLSIVKMLVEDKLDGTISVKNTKDGVQFEVIF